jgi:hypothetical protein
MGLREEMIKHIRKITGDPNADLWTLQFNPDDEYKTKDQIHPPHYIGRVPIRTHEDIEKDRKEIQKYAKKPYFSNSHFLK